jgi:hypothetical protein
LQGLLHHGKSVQLRSLEVGHDLHLQGILDTFKDLFQEPQGLPPSRLCDHRICLKEGSDPVVVRPYRYPHRQKDEIERQCTEMLAQGIIRPSHSPFSSPVLLVRKADGSWRFCVDYRELNATTIKDKILHQIGFAIRVPPGSDAPSRCGKDGFSHSPWPF